MYKDENHLQELGLPCAGVAQQKQMWLLPPGAMKFEWKDMKK